MWATLWKCAGVAVSRVVPPSVRSSGGGPSYWDRLLSDLRQRFSVSLARYAGGNGATRSVSGRLLP